MLDAGVHPGWVSLLGALHGAGLGTAILTTSLAMRLGAAAKRPPEPSVLTRMLDEYYRGDGNVDVGLVRVRGDRLVLHREGDRATARQIVARLRLALPALGPLGLIEGRDGELVLRTQGTQEPLSPELLEEERLVIDGAVYSQRTVTVRALVAATNVLLSRRRITHRFVPLTLADGIEGYVALGPADTVLLEAEGLLDEPLDELRTFGCWDRAPLSMAS
jgi:hypothetical protein